MPDLLLPGLMMILGAALVPVLPHMLRQVWMLVLIAASAYQCWHIDPGVHLTASVIGFDLILVRAEAITRPFALVFHIAAALNVIYAMHEDSRMTAATGLAYAGAAIAALFAGDFITLFIYWELTAFTSVFLILAGRNPRSFAAAMRYLLTQVTSGVILLAGAVVLVGSGSGIAIPALSVETLGGALVLLAFAIKAAFPFVNGWLQDAYPEASVTGTVILSAFTTKLAIYMLALCFAGTHMLIWFGVVMTLFPVFFAVIENDLRRVLAFSLNNQLGFMVVGIGIGTELALNGTVAHAFAHIIYKSLLFMSMGAVLYRTGTAKASELGGLWKRMPLTTLFCIIGAVSISSFPLFSGFVTKSLTIGSAAYEGYFWVWVALIFASAGVLEHSGIKIPYFAFFGHDRGFKVREAPFSMLVAMGIAAGLCVAIGVAPEMLYALLPYEVTYKVWDAGHVLGELQLLLFAVLAFAFLMLRGLYPPEIDSTVLNTDWLFRKAAPALWRMLANPVMRLWHAGLAIAARQIVAVVERGTHISRNNYLISGTATIGAAAGLFLAVFALLLALRYMM
ncbi:MAG: Na(+)/H(+) antiporter subunit D [Rhodobiaceae bacterium]|nr:Na(+)/H(+) antiporter subunit D [Rhodobiaceae bacterium]OUT91816.1 MAG: Na(+)/H(+) antiporter subunit D [Rhizobiales bacterium TMED29]